MQKIILRSVFLILFSFLLSSCSEEKKYTFRFPKIGISSERESEKIVSEIRFLPIIPSQGEIRLFVDELVLGPQTPRLRPLFSLGTSVEFCFLFESDEKNVLYVGLSEKAIGEEGSSCDIQRGISLFCQNIRTNFKNIEEIVLFIGGIVVNEYQN